MLSLRPSGGHLRDGEVKEFTLDGGTVRSYSSSDTSFAIVVLHGLTREGFNDYRLIRFCRMLANIGFSVYTPSLRGLCTLDPDASDIEATEALLESLTAKHGDRIGIIGFSFGGTYSLIAAGAPGVADHIRFVMAVGAYYSLESLIDRAFTLRGEKPLAPKVAYALLSLDWKYRQLLALTREETAVFEDLMDHYCARENNFTSADSVLVAKIAALPAQHEVCRQWKERLGVLSRLNIAGNPSLRSLVANVFLLHSERDVSVPVEECTFIETELVNAGKSVSKHVGRLGDHVVFSIRDDIRLASFFYRVMLLTEKV